MGAAWALQCSMEWSFLKVSPWDSTDCWLQLQTHRCILSGWGPENLRFPQSCR